MFLLLMQFLIKYLPEIVGKGLPKTVILELMAYNLAYMVVLAVPMSVLIASLMTFGQLAETNAYAVMKSSGISLPQLLWPALIVGLLLTGGMTYFNNEVLPEANFRAKNLWQDIRRKKPGFELQEGVFYEGLNDYAILVQRLPPESNELVDVTIYDYSEGASRRADIKAERGILTTSADGGQVELVLERGEVHRRLAAAGLGEGERYELLRFGRYRLAFDLSDFAFERSDPTTGYRSDRTMRTIDMARVVDSLEMSLGEKRATLRETMRAMGVDSLRMTEELLLTRDLAPWDTVGVRTTASTRRALAGLDARQRSGVFDRALQNARMARARLDDTRRTIEWENQRADRYRVEIYKKYSIALACLIFVLIGAPLGLSIRRGGLGTAGALAIGIFLFYWVTLVQGEKLADRGLLPPWVGMWGANIVMALGGLWLVLYVTLDLRATPPLRRRLAQRLANWFPARRRSDGVAGDGFRVSGSPATPPSVEVTEAES